MALNEQFGRSSSNTNKVSLPTMPDPKALQKLLSDLSISTTGTECDISWQVGTTSFTLGLVYSRQHARASWKLYRSKGLQQNLIWEHSTNDVSVVFAAISAETSKQILIAQSQNRLPAQPTANKIIPADRADRRAVNINNNLSGKLRTLFIGAQDIVSGAETEMPIVKSQLANKPAAGYIDLSPGRQLLQNLFVNQFGIFSYPTFLFFLEREYYEAAASNAVVTLVVFKMSAAPGAPISPAVLEEIVKRIKVTQRKTDVLAQGKENQLMVLLPDTSTDGGKAFVRRAEKALFKTPLAPGLNDTNIKFTFGLATLGKHCQTLPALLGFAEQALTKALQTGKNMVCDHEILPELTANVQTITSQPIDLAPTQQLVSELVSGGIFTYPAFLAFLENEYHRSARKKSELLVMILKLRVYEETFDEPANMLPSPAYYEVIRRVGKLLTKRDIFAQYADRNFVIMRSNTSVAQMGTFAKKVIQSITGEQWLAPDCPASSLRTRSEIYSVRAHETNPDLLGLVAVS